MPDSRKPTLRRSPDPEHGEGEGVVEGPTGRIRITLVKSPTGYDEQQKRTVRALGLRRLRQSVEQADTPVVRGMIAKIPHLVSVQPVPESV